MLRGAHCDSIAIDLVQLKDVLLVQLLNDGYQGLTLYFLGALQAPKSATEEQ